MNDDLDRAIFSLPLAESPADLRSSILAATVYAQRAILRPGEMIGIGVALAFLVWCVLAVALPAGPLAESASDAVRSLVAVFSNLQVLLWSGVGMAAVFWLWILEGPILVRRRS